MAYYGDEHVARVKMIRQLQHERFLPLKAIRALLDEQEEVFTPAQRRLMQDVKSRLEPALTGARGTRGVDAVDADEWLARTNVSREDLSGLVEVGMLGVVEDPARPGRSLIARDDTWMLELWGEMRAAGFTVELGFSPRDLTVFEAAISMLFREEVELVSRRLGHLPPERVAAMVERALPLIHTFLSRYHATRIRNFFATVAEPSAPNAQE